MPGPLKNRAAGTDAAAMSETAVTPSNSTEPAEDFFLDGAAPRLGSSPMVAPAPLGGADAATLEEPVAIVAEAPFLRPTVAVSEAEFALPTLPAVAPQRPTMIEDQPWDAGEPTDGTEAEPAHPMAHMMPSKSKPSAAAARAAEIRAARKAKSKKIKIGVAIGALVVSALAGPPLVSWLTNAINEAGGINNEEPAP
jgi:hypothetical protein